MEPVLQTEHLTKYYGRLKALDDLGFSINKGEVFGILGPNGSGKTTTLGILLGIIVKSGGSYRWFGKPPDHRQRKKIGALLETPLFYPYLSAVQNLKIIADIKGCGYGEIEKHLKLTGLYERRNSAFKTYSLGMKQRLAIAAALLNNPEVLILDEPTNGLDPRGIADIRNLILKIAEQGITIILASHILDEVEKICSHVLVLDKGKKLFSGRVNEVLGGTGIVEMACNDNEQLLGAARTMDWFQKGIVEDGKVVVHLKHKTDPAEINRRFAAKGIYLSHLSMQKKSLENYFLELLSEKNDTTYKN